MATLEKIRQKGVLLSIVIGVAMLLFIIGMVDFNSIFGNSRQTVAEVGSDEINIAEFEKRIDEMTSFYKIESGQSSLSEQYTEQIRTTVWNNYVKELVLKAECEKLGIQVSDDELADKLTGNNPHPMLSQLRVFYNPEKGGYDKEIMFQLVNAVNQEPDGDYAKYMSFVQRTIRLQILEDKYTALTGAAINLNNLDARFGFDALKGFDVEYTFTPYSTISDSLISASEKDLKKYYSDNRNRYYVDSELRGIKMVTFDIVPSDNDFNEIGEWIEGLKKDFFTSDDFVSICNQNSDVSYNGIAKSKSETDSDLAEFAFSGKAGDTFGPQLFGNVFKMARIVESGITAPDSAKVRHILVQEADEAKTKALADSLVAALKAGSDFAELAKQFSKAGTATNGGELGWLREGDFDMEFSTACINATVGKVFTKPMGAGIQIIEVTEKTAPVAKVKLCVLERSVEPSSQTYAQIYNEASQYMAQNTTLEKFENGVDPSRGQFVRSFNVGKSDYNVAGLKDSRQIVRWVYESKKGEVADKVFECGDKFVVVALASISEEGYPDFEEVKERVTSDYKNDKKAEMIIADLNGKLAAGDLAATGNVATAQNVTFGSQYVSGVGVEPEMYATVSTMTPDSKPVAVKGSNGVYVVKVVAVKDNGEFDAATEIAQLSNRRPYRYMLYNSIEKGTKIKDNRINFY